MHYKRLGGAKRFTVPPLKEPLVTTSGGSAVFYTSGRVVNTMRAAYTGEGKTGEGCLLVAETARLRRDLPMADTVTDVTCELDLLTSTGAT